MILCATNEFFHGLLNFSSQADKQEKNEIVINVKGDVLESVIKCCYTGQIDINNDNIEDLLSAASFFLFPYLQKKCTEYLSGYGILDATNCIGIFVLASRYMFQDMKNLAVPVICDSFLEVVECDEFNHLSRNELLEILASDHLSVDSERDVFNALVKWIQFDLDARRALFPELVVVIRVNRLDDEFFMGRVQSVCGLLESPTTFDKLCHRKYWHANQGQCRQSPERFSPLSDFIAIKHSEVRQENAGMLVQRYSQKTKRWIRLNTAPINRSWFGAELIGKELIIIGGKYRSYAPVNTVSTCFILYPLSQPK